MTVECIYENCSNIFSESIPHENLTRMLTSSWDTQFRDSAKFWVQHVLMPVVLIIGLIGNILTIYILTRRNMRSSTNRYLTALAYCDLVFLIVVLAILCKNFKLMEGVWLYSKFITIALWFANASFSASVWITVCFTTERYIAVCHPMTEKIHFTEKRAKFLTTLVCMVCLLANVTILFEWEPVAKLSLKTDTEKGQNHTNLTTILGKFTKIYVLKTTKLCENNLYRFFTNWMIIIVFVVVPFFWLSILNVLLVNAVRVSRAVRESMISSHLQHQTRLQSMRKEEKITLTLIAVVIVFLVCQMPTATVLIYRAVNKPAKHDSFEENILVGLENIFNLLVTINAACNFLLYTALSDNYRKLFFNLILFKCLSQNQHGNHTRNTSNVRCIVNKRNPA